VPSAPLSYRTVIDAVAFAAVVEALRAFDR
jgi:hypothetical protein